MKILIVKTSAIGDVIHTLPALHALRKKYPGAQIDWLVEEAAAGVIQGHPAVNRVLVSKRRRWLKELKGPCRWQVLKEVRAFIRELRKTEYDLLIDFQSLLKSGIFVWLARAGRKVGFDKGMEHAECSYIFLNERVPPVDMDQHAVVRELSLLEAIGVKCDGIVFGLPVTSGHRRAVSELLRQKKVDETRPIAAVNPMTTWETKHWQKERFAALADRLQEAFTVVFTGGDQDRADIDSIRAMMDKPAANMAGKTGLKELAALYERAAVLITTDTGPMHVAAAVGTPVVALFGPTAPWRTGPFGANHQVVRLGLPCSPCLKKQCELGTTACMRDISVDRVLAAVKKVAGERGHEPG